MLVIFIILYMVTILSFFWFKAVKRSVVKILIYTSMIGVLVIFYIFWIKSGGFLPGQQEIIFGSKKISSFITRIYVVTDTLAIGLSACRLMFPLLILIDSLNVYNGTKLFLSKRKYIYPLLAVPMVIAFVITLPQVFTSSFAFQTDLQAGIALAVNLLIVTYLLVAVALHIIELSEISLSWYKKRHKYLMVAMIAMIIQFSYFLGFDPISIFQDYNKVYYISQFLRYFNTRSFSLWVAVLTVCILSTLVSMWQLYKYSKYDYDRDKQELIISKAVSGVSVPVSTIVHGVKNQIIASKILSENAMDAMNEDDKNEAVKMIGKLQTINDIILKRMDYLYKSFKNLQTVLVLTDVGKVIEAVKAKVGNVIAETQIAYKVIDEYVIADVELLSEAIYNFVINAFEAVPLSRDPKIVVDTYTTRAHVVITIEDNGCGISKAVQAKLFEPFISNKNSDKNWGLGLCNARKIVVNHLGYVRFDTQENVGTKFYIVLPNYKPKKENKK